MRKAYPIIFFLLVTVVFNATIVFSQDDMTVLRYREDSSVFTNPERGWWWVVSPAGGGNPGNNFEPHPPFVLDELLELRAQGITLIRDMILIPVQYHRAPISDEYLARLQADFDTIRAAGMKSVPRFHYTWSMINEDPPEDIVMMHLAQVQPLLERNADVIFYLEAGLFSGTGEGTDDFSEYWNFTGITEMGERVLARLLEVLPEDRQLAVRLPRHKRAFLDIGFSDWLTAEQAFTNAPIARLGYYSDAFFYDGRDANFLEWGKELEDMEYVNNDTEYLISTAEPSWDSDFALMTPVIPTLERYHMSAMTLNQGDVQLLYRKWRETGEFDEISRRLGYRFRLLEAEMPPTAQPGSVLNLSLEMQNDGFARLINPRLMEIILREETSGQEYVLTVEPPQDIRLWLPGAGDDATLDIQGALPADLPEGSYRVLLNLPDPYPALYGRPEYSIRLANAGVWEAHTGYNDLRHTLIIAGDAVDAAADLPVFTTGRVYSPDTTAPSPAPGWASAPISLSVNAVQVEATLVYDLSDAEYYFECIEGECHDSGWQRNTLYVDRGLAMGGSYTYRVRARDLSESYNETDWSQPITVATRSEADTAVLAPWQNLDIGEVYDPGSALYYAPGGVFTIAGSGQDIFGDRDGFHYVYQTWTGDATIIARLESFEAINKWAKAGVMIRETTNRSSAFAMMLISFNAGSSFQWREGVLWEADHFTPGNADSAPYWVRLDRRGDIFTGFVSPDGVNWSEVGSREVLMAAEVTIGLGVTAHDNTIEAAVARFDELTITGGDAN
jgi:hypothetical protein